MNSIYKYILIVMISYPAAQCDYDIGDSNDDNYLNVIDVVSIINNIINEEDFNVVYDLNFDLIINISDIIIIVNKIVNVDLPIVEINSVEYDFQDLSISWSISSDFSFESYKIFYYNLISQDAQLIFTTNNIEDNSVLLTNFNLKEQNWFYIVQQDFFGCELISPQYFYELPYIHYEIDDLGNIPDNHFDLEDFQSASECQSCHESHYEEWSSSMHSHSMNSPIFFSYKNKTLEDHPDIGDKFCTQCHNPVAYLTNTNLENFDSYESLQGSDLSPILKEGIGCDVCHTTTGLSQSVFTPENGAASAIYKLYPGENIKFGSIENPISNSYHESYYLPTYSSSNMCLPCHDLVVNNLEAEITFTEWNRIPGFSMFGGVSCQECHMPIKPDGTHDHSFIGADLDLTIPYESNPEYQKVLDMMNSALTLNFGIWGIELSDSVSNQDTLIVPLTIESLTAHNIPSGTSFNRDVWLELLVFNDQEIIYSSGAIENSSENLDYNDTDLLSFKNYLLTEENDTTRSVLDAYEIINNSLAPYSQRFKQYKIPLSEDISGEFIITARMLFRPFDPNFILEHHADFINNLPIFEMYSINSTIYIND